MTAALATMVDEAVARAALLALPGVHTRGAQTTHYWLGKTVFLSIEDAQLYVVAMPAGEVEHWLGEIPGSVPMLRFDTKPGGFQVPLDLVTPEQFDRIAHMAWTRASELEERRIARKGTPPPP